MIIRAAGKEVRMGGRYDKEYEDKEAFSPWETYSDLYCGLLLVFVLLFFFAIYQYIDTRERDHMDTLTLQEEMKEEQASVLALYKADLADQERAYQEKSKELETQRTALAIMRGDLEERTALLEDQQALIDDQKQKLSVQQSKLQEQESQLAGKQAQLYEQQGKIQDQESQLSQQAALLEEQRSVLESQQSQLAEQQGILESQLIEQQQALDSQAVQIDQIVGVRRDLINALNMEMSANQIQVQADQATGAIALESTILFARDSNELSQEGMDFFSSFMPVYLNVLLQPGFREYIAEIIIEGHTDNSGSYLHNLDLSQRRAWSVAEYIMRDDCPFLTQEQLTDLKSLATVNGCSYKALIYKEDGTIDEDRSRRVEIKFRLKDREMLQEMDKILNDHQ